MPRATTPPDTPTGAEAEPVTVLWLPAGLSCDGDSIALTAATQPSVEDLLGGTFPGAAPLTLHWPLLGREAGDAFLEPYHEAAAGRLGRFVLVVEGSVANERLANDGSFTGFGVDDAGQPITFTRWIERLAPHAWAVVATGTCAAYGGIHGMEGNPTGAMGVPDLLGWDWRSEAGIPIVCVPGCPVQPDSMAEVLLWLLCQSTGANPMIPLDDVLRPTWLFSLTVHEGCDRGGFYEQGEFAAALGDVECIVKQGCWGPVVRCNVPKRGWMNGIGGCPNVGGICIGCTMPGFPDKFMPFMDEPPGGKLSSMLSKSYGGAMRRMRDFTARGLDEEPAWRRPSAHLLSGLRATWMEDEPPDDHAPGPDPEEGGA